MDNLSDHAELFQVSSAVTVGLFGFIFYYILAESAILRKWLNFSRGELREVMLRRLSGILILGGLSFFVFLHSGSQSLAHSGLTPAKPETYLWTILLAMVILPMNYFHSGSVQNQRNYPQIRVNEWTISLLFLSATTWIIYLFSYEFFLRGILLFASIPILGLWPSIFLNTSIYSLVHLPKGLRESVGAVPYGVLLCYLTYQTNSIWIAFFSHVIMALSGEWFSLRANPKMFVRMDWT